MLQNIHDKAKGWVAYLIVGLISVPFALFGINSYLGGSGNRIVAEINGEEVEAGVVNQELVSIKQQFAQFPEFDDGTLKQLALDRVISRTLLQQEVKEQGYRIGDELIKQEIAQAEPFQTDGRFDPKLYRQVLASNRISEASHVSQIRNGYAQDQFQNLVAATAFLPKEEAEKYQALQNQKRDINTFTLKISDFKKQAQASEAQVLEYYNKNKSRYMTAEQVKVDYIELKQADFASSISASDDELRSFYDAAKDRYSIPEKRQASHIVIAISSPEKDAEAEKKAKSLAAEIAAGSRSFDEVAKAESADSLSADKGGDLGVIVAGDWGKEFNDVVFSLNAGDVSSVVKTAAGYEIIKVRKIEETQQKTFEEAKADVEKDFRNEQAVEMFQSKDDELPTLAYENENDLAPVAEQLRVEMKTSDWFDRSKGEGVAQLAQVRDLAFSDAVKTSARNSDKLDITDEHSIVIRVVDQKPASQKAIELVKDEISQTLQDQEARKLINKKGEELLAVLQNGSVPSELTSDAENSVEKHGLIERGNAKIPAQVVEAAFAMNKPAGEKPTHSNVILPNGDYSLITLNTVKENEPKVDKKVIEGFGLKLGNREQSAMLQALREEADIQLYPENL